MGFFKGWAIPGPRLQRDRVDLPPVEADETLDAISGEFRLFQLKKGHRFSTDDVLTAWYGTTLAPSVSTALDLGSGIGSVGMIAAWRLPGARFVTIEAQDESVRLARKSANYNELLGRYEIRQGDFRDPGLLAPEERFELILGSPPYFPLDAGVLGDHPQKVACRFETRGDVGDYCRVAAAHLAPGGLFACVFPIQPHQISRVRSGARDAGLTITKWRPVCLKEGEPPLLGVFAMVVSTDLPEAFRERLEVKEPVLVIRLADGTISPEYSTVKMSVGFPPA